MSKSNLNSRKTTAEDRYNACIGYFSRYPLLLCEKLTLTLKVSRIRLLGAFQLHLTILMVAWWWTIDMLLPKTS